MDTPALFRLLGDETRLRLLRLLSREALNVSELTAVSGRRPVRRLPSPRAAARCRPGRRKSGPAPSAGTGCRPSQTGDGSRDAASGPGCTRSSRTRRRPPARTMRGSRKSGGCAKRSSRSTATQRQQMVPGRSWAAWARALGLLLPPLDVADLGCGEGYLTIEAARWARRVIAIDRSADVLARGRAPRRAPADRQHRLEARRARAAADQGRVDRSRAAVAGAPPCRGPVRGPGRSLAHPAARRPRADPRSARGTTSNWVRAKLGDRWLGFDDEQLRGLIDGAGFEDTTVRVGSRRDRAIRSRC